MTRQTIVAVVDDLMFQSRLEQHVRALDYAFVAVDRAQELQEAIEQGPALVIVDLHANCPDWSQAVSMAKEHALPVLAYGRHTEAGLLRAARAAGCDRVVARSQLVEELPVLIEELARSRISEE